MFKKLFLITLAIFSLSSAPVVQADPPSTSTIATIVAAVAAVSSPASGIVVGGCIATKILTTAGSAAVVAAYATIKAYWGGGAK